MTLDTGTHVLYGDWRRRVGSKTDAHLYRKGVGWPACGKTIDRRKTVALDKGRPCSECLVAEITRVSVSVWLGATRLDRHRMGQYHLTVNLDKREYIHPHSLGDGLKLWEQAASSEGGIGSALIVLLAVSNHRGGGDLAENEMIGRWGGDRIAIVGDYAKDTDLPAEFAASTIYNECRAAPGAYRDITAEVRAVLAAELSLTYGGDGWMDRRRKGDDEPTPPAMAPDMVLR